jgi:hypothetical protein
MDSTTPSSSRLVLLALALAALLASTMIWFNRIPQVSPPNSGPVPQSQSQPHPKPSLAWKRLSKPATSQAGVQPASPDSGAFSAAGRNLSQAGAQAKHTEFVAKRCAELEALAFEEDNTSLQIICSELTNRDPEIRKAARGAAIQFASRDAIPPLLDAASQTDDPQEKQALIDAAEFLKLPSLTEVTQNGVQLSTPVFRPVPIKKGPGPRTQELRPNNLPPAVPRPDLPGRN